MSDEVEVSPGPFFGAVDGVRGAGLTDELTVPSVVSVRHGGADDAIAGLGAAVSALGEWLGGQADRIADAFTILGATAIDADRLAALQTPSAATTTTSTTTSTSVPAAEAAAPAEPEVSTTSQESPPGTSIPTNTDAAPPTTVPGSGGDG